MLDSISCQTLYFMHFDGAVLLNVGLARIAPSCRLPQLTLL